MLHHERLRETQALPAVEFRVSGEELVQAMAAIEARREAAAHELAETITIGEAIRELELDATPEEIRAVVQSSRSTQAAAAAKQRARRRWRRALLGAVLPVSTLLVPLTLRTLAPPLAPVPDVPVSAAPAAGVALVDVNNDGAIDLYVDQGRSGPGVLFRNDGSGLFTETGGDAITDPSQPR
jgi:hypothetical protein